MAFQLLEEEPEPKKPRWIDLGMLMFRVGAVATYFYYQLASQLEQGFSYVWNHSPWELVEQVAALHYPMPGVAASVSIGVQAIATFGILLGFFTRFNGFLLTVMTGFVFLTGITLSPTLNPQALVLYLALFFGLSLGGAGRLSLDYLLAGRRARRRDG